MPNPGQREYLEAKVMTANPAQLQLMLIDGALRFGREAEKALLRGDEETAQPLLLRTMKIVGECLAGVKQGESEINEKLTQLYEFVYGRLTSVYVNSDHKQMAEALQILEYEQETWRMACKKVAEEKGNATGSDPSQSGPKPAAPPVPHLGSSAAPTSGGLSIEA